MYGLECSVCSFIEVILVTMEMKSSGMPKNPSVWASCVLCVFNAEVEVSYSPRARASRSEAFLFWASDIVRFYIIGGQYGEARCPEFI